MKIFGRKEDFEIYPAIDLRGGRVVRLRTGDPEQQTTYEIPPQQAAREWCSMGVGWLHVVNLDGAFGESGAANLHAITQILAVTAEFGVKVQLGGGIRSMETLEDIFDLGVSRAILGTVLVEEPQLLRQAISHWGKDCMAAGIDARGGIVQVRGWQQPSTLRAPDLAEKMAEEGLEWLIYTDISRDGTGRGANLKATAALANHCGLNVIASGGFRQVSEVSAARELGLAGVILGRSLYDGQIKLDDAIRVAQGGNYAG